MNQKEDFQKSAKQARITLKIMINKNIRENYRPVFLINTYEQSQQILTNQNQQHIKRNIKRNIHYYQVNFISGTQDQFNMSKSINK